MKRLKSIISLTIAVLMAATMFGCSKGTGSEGGNSSSTKGYEWKAPKLTNPNIYLMDNPDDANWKAAKETYESIYGAGTVTIDNVPFADRSAKFMALCAAGDAPAIYGCNFPQDPIKGLMRPLDDLIDLKDPVWDLKSMDDVKWNGKYYMASGNIYAQVVFFNKTMFENSGEKTPYEYWKEGKWNFDTFKQVAKKMTQDTNKDGTPDIWGYATASNLQILFIFANGGTLFKSTSDGKIVSTLKDKSTIGGLQMFEDGRFNEKWYMPGGPDVNKEFPAGHVAMMIGQPMFTINNALKGMSQEWGAAPIPVGPENKDGLQPVKFYPRGIPTYTKNPEAGAAFLRILSAQEIETDKQIYTEWPDKTLGEVVNNSKAHPLVINDAVGDWKNKQWAFYGDLSKGIPVATVIENHEPILNSCIEAVLADNKVDLTATK